MKVRHNRVRDNLFELMAKAGLQPERKVTLSPPHADLRPADILIKSTGGTWPTAVDITISHPLTSSKTHTVTVVRNTALVCEKEKKDKYTGPCTDCEWKFQPFAMTTFGAFGPSTRSFWRDIAYLLFGDMEPWLRGIKMAQYRHRLSGTLMQCIAEQLRISED